MNPYYDKIDPALHEVMSMCTEAGIPFDVTVEPEPGHVIRITNCEDDEPQRFVLHAV